MVCVSHMKKKNKKFLKPSSSARLNAVNSHLLAHTDFTGIPASEGDFLGFHTVHFHTHALNSSQILLQCGLRHSIVTGVLERSFNCIGEKKEQQRRVCGYSDLMQSTNQSYKSLLGI